MRLAGFFCAGSKFVFARQSSYIEVLLTKTTIAFAQLFNRGFAPMRRTSPLKRGKNQPAEDSYQSSRSRYLRAFAKARAMRFWRPRVPVKPLGVAAAFAAALALGSSEARAQFPP